MKVIILAGGYGTRISEESQIKPKPMITIGEMPILLHIMKTYSHFGFDDFIICCGYKGHMIKEFFSNYFLHMADVTFDFSDGGKMIVHNSISEKWRVTLVDTGIDTMTGGRIKRIQPYVSQERFMLTYGDGVADVNINSLIQAHDHFGGLVTLTAVKPQGRFGALKLSEGNRVSSFREKPKGDGTWISGGFFVCEPDVFSYLQDDTTVWEREPMETIAREKKLFSYKHNGFWQHMDTLSDKNLLEEMWKTGQAPWKVW